MIAAAPTTCAPAASATARRLARRAAGRDDVLDDEHAIGWRQREAAAQRQRAVLTLGEHRADAERAPDFLADDDAAERRRQDDGRLQVRVRVRQRVAERVGELGILQHERALQVAVAVQPGRQPEVPFEQRAGLAEQIEDRAPDPSVGRLSVLAAAGCPRTA